MIEAGIETPARGHHRNLLSDSTPTLAPSAGPLVVAPVSAAGCSQRHIQREGGKAAKGTAFGDI